MENKEDSRKAFELEMIDNHHCVPSDFGLQSDGSYLDDDLNNNFWLWQAAWQHQEARIAELESREPRFIWTGTEVDDAMILIDRMDDSLEPERIAQLEQILPRLGARIAEIEAQTAHMADLVELANNATERADKLEAQVKELQRVPLSDKQIMEQQEKYVGCPTPSYPLGASDWIEFARAIEAAHNIK